MEKSSVDVWLWLLLVMKPYNRKTNFILYNCGYNAVTAARQIRDGDLKFLDESEKRRAEEVRSGTVNELKQLCADNNIQIITFDDEDYPKLLRHIENPPVVLFVQGDITGLNDRLCVSAVGTRGVSEYSKKCARSLCGALAKVGTVIVSGLAVGADSEAHKACLAANGKTLGVLACGNLVNYPTASKQLKQDIIASGGALISELLPNTKVPQGYFHSRNRIISGLSHGTLVIQAPESSGSLISANFAVEQGREVFCVPPCDIFDKDYSGVVPLIRDGAVPVFDYTDIIDAFPMLESVTEFSGVEYPHKSGTPKAPRIPKAPKTPNPAESKPVKKAASDTSKKKVSEKDKTVEKTKAPEISPERLTALSPCEAEIIKLLFAHPMDEDSLIDKTGRDFAEVSEALANLEIEGFITRNMDGTFKPITENT